VHLQPGHAGGGGVVSGLSAKALKIGSTHKSYRLLEADPPDPAVGRRLYWLLAHTVRVPHVPADTEQRGRVQRQGNRLPLGGGHQTVADCCISMANIVDMFQISRR